MSGDVEMGTCVFCKKETELTRTYLHGCKQTNEHDGFIIIHHCWDCTIEEIERKDITNANLLELFKEQRSFIQWYSGMEQSKIDKAFIRFKKEHNEI